MQATGRALHIEGPVSLQWSFIPTVAVEGVRLQNAPWGSQPDMLSVKRAEVQLALVPLFSGEIRIRKIVLEAPMILIKANTKGQKNWIFDKPAGKEEMPLRKLSIDIAELRIEQGDPSYRAAPPSKTTRLLIDRLQMQEDKPDAATPDGKFIINDITLAGGQAQWSSGALEVTYRDRPTSCGKLARKLAFRGIVFGHVILAVTREELLRIRSHEPVHVQQCERWGQSFFLAYAASSILQLIRGRGA